MTALALPGFELPPLRLPKLDWRDLIAKMAFVLANSGRAVVTNRIHGAGTEPLNIGWGTGTGTSSATDTSLFTETALNLSTTTGSRTAGTASQATTAVTNDTYKITATLTAAAAGTVTNAGAFDNITIGSGNLYLKGDFAGIALNSGDSIAFTFSHQLT